MGFDIVAVSLGYCLGLFVLLFSPTYSCSKLKKENKNKKREKRLHVLQTKKTEVKYLPSQSTYYPQNTVRKVDKNGKEHV